MGAAAAEEQDRKRSNPIRLSNAGRCQRQTAYSFLNWKADSAGQARPFPYEPLEPRVLVNFTLGNLTELTLVDWLLKKAPDRFLPLSDSRKNMVSIDLGAGYVATGHLDGLWQEEDGSLSAVDFKSINSYGFERTEDQGPAFDNIAQVNSYCYALSLKTWRLFYLRKETGHVCEWFGEFSQELLDITISKLSKAVHSSVLSLPDREFSAKNEKEWVRGMKRLIGSGADVGGPDPDGKIIVSKKKTGYWRETGRKILEYPCSYCPFKPHCWPGVEMEMKGDYPNWIVP
jgi:hypothetical protein